MHDTFLNRFWAKVAVPQNVAGCWVWIGNRPDGRYGKIKFRGKSLSAHRVSYEIHFDAIPQGKWVLHHCDNPACVNPNHLYAGDGKDNVRDKIERTGYGFCERHGMAKLQNQDVSEIRSMWRNASRKYGIQTALARLYGVNRLTIHRAIYNENWKRLQTNPTVTCSITSS